ncbi:ATP-binding protein [uncultured Pseudacidovorax sp.]|uniref:ATP-binding protein n=1 Tax=uncultured Pseudacidovorax sp. TaxID=679313 RepID=UPI0025CE86AC|nr:ATP-binding protein [uncultured Pseudacidovorax sp.]
MEQEDLLYDPRFFEAHAGSIITDPATAIVELVANCWDAYATDVQITWPDPGRGKQFRIKDNGKGMPLEMFQGIWRTMAYDKLGSESPFSDPPPGVEGSRRAVFVKSPP